MVLQMKTIKFEGKQYEVPDWVNFVVRNEDGGIVGHYDEPIYLSHNWHSFGESYVIVDNPISDWRRSLTEV